jgi:hypothetical protein
MARDGTAPRPTPAVAATVLRMKSILKATFAAAVAAGVFGALLGRLVARQAEAFRRLRLADEVPTVHPITDAKPHVETPLQESDVREPLPLRSPA